MRTHRGLRKVKHNAPSRNPLLEPWTPRAAKKCSVFIAGSSGDEDLSFDDEDLRSRHGAARSGLVDLRVESEDLNSKMTAGSSTLEDLHSKSSVPSKDVEKKLPAASSDAPAASSEQEDDIVGAPSHRFFVPSSELGCPSGELGAGGRRFGAGSNEKSPQLDER
jgi:hypothetical protein